MAVTTSLKRGALEDAKDASIGATVVVALRTKLRSYETAARQAIAGGSLASVSANGRDASFSVYGAGQFTPVEAVELWRDLIDRFDSSKAFLEFCALYDLDPEETERDSAPSPLPDALEEPATVSDTDIYDWMMSHLVAVTEIQSDYSDLRM